MKTLLQKQMLLLVAAIVILPTGGCGSRQRSEIVVDGRKIVVSGGTSHSTEQEGNILRISVDSHNIVVAERTLTINGVESQIPEYREILLTVDGGTVSVELDGRPFPGETGTEGAGGQPRGAPEEGEERSLPEGFVRASGAGGSGEVLYLETTHSQAASRQLLEAIETLSTYFDEPVTSMEGFRGRDDRQAQVTFTGRLDGQAVSGVAVSLVLDDEGLVGVVFDRSDLLPKTIGPLMSTMQKALPLPEGGGRPAQQDLGWHVVYFPDGSGRINLPRGWRVTSSYKGGADIAGPDGEAMAVGIGVPVAVPEAVINPMTGMPMQGALVGYPGNPAEALANIAPQLAASSARGNPQAPMMSDLRIVESSPVASPTNGQAAYILYDVRVNGILHRAFSLVDCSPVSAGWWTFYYSTVAAPRDRFEDKFPVMLRAWQGWSVNPQVF